MILTEYFQLAENIFTHKRKLTFITQFNTHICQKLEVISQEPGKNNRKFVPNIGEILAPLSLKRQS